MKGLSIGNKTGVSVVSSGGGGLVTSSTADSVVVSCPKDKEI